MAERFVNQAQTALAEAIDASVTSFDLDDASGLPNSGDFRLRVEGTGDAYELMLVTDITASTVTVTRGVENTSATSHANGAVATHVLTAGAIAALKAEGVAEVATEKTARESTDAALETALAAKQDASTAATDTELATEKTAREAADATEKSARETAVSGEATTRALADSTEKTAREAADASEKSARETADALLQPKSEKGQASGYPELDGSGHVPAGQMPVGALTYKGTWNAATNTPTLADNTGSVGQEYIVTTAGTRNLGSGSIEFTDGSVILHNGTVWQQVAGADAVGSVFGRQGAVTAQSGDYSLAQITGLTAALEGKQATDSDLTAIAALSTTSYGRAFLALADAAAGRTALGLGTAAVKDSGSVGESGKVLKSEGLEANGVGRVVCGTDLTKARPTGFSCIEWELNTGVEGVPEHISTNDHVLYKLA